MKVCVCLKEVPDPSAPKRIDPQTMRLDRSGAGALNEFDTHALEEGLRVREEAGEGEVVAVLMGPERAADSLRKALAIGADRSVHVVDDALAGSDLVATSKVLASALEREQPDLVLFGQQGASLELAEGRAKVKRQTEYGYDVIEAPLPCVVAVSDAINEPRYPSLKGIMGAKKKPQENLALDELGVSAGEVGSRTEVYALSDPPPRGETVRIEDDGNAAERIIEYLAQRKLV
jgi:electron transfer flavoprotein beta subunit